jgi:hypothetical protein
LSLDPHGESNQPLPTQNEHPAVWDLVIEDIKKRDTYGLQKYGTRLQPHNGRDALRDAYEEALDLVVYLRQCIHERATVEDAVKAKHKACIDALQQAIAAKDDDAQRDILNAVIHVLGQP